MAKRKTPKVDLKPRAEKVTEAQLKRAQALAKAINETKFDIGAIEAKKHSMLHEYTQFNHMLEEMLAGFEKEYGSSNVNIQDGTIKYKEDEQTDS